MHVSYRWLQSIVPVTAKAEDLAAGLTACGLEVASIKTVKIPAGIVVGRILTRNKHPKADRLSVCSVDIGAEAPLAIVCGAPNAAAGMTVAVATIGTQIAPDFVIKKAALRGVESFGMLCSEQELGLSNEHSGILSLPEDHTLGVSVSEYIPDDIIFEIEITPNRGDCLSMLGVAREVSARFSVPFAPPVRTPDCTGIAVDKKISVRIEDSNRCARYMGRFIDGVTIKESPRWLIERLVSAGMRPINNVIDITNYILLEFGQPMHAFDYNRIAGQQILVKKAGTVQKFTTLDGIQRDLVPEDLLICDAHRPVALAGIMGGEGSKIADTTTAVFLECAFFEAAGIRRTSKRLGISTDSSYRFERGVDCGAGLEQALDTAASLIAELSGGTVSAGVIDETPIAFEPKIVGLRPKRAALVLGVELSSSVVDGYLIALGFVKKSTSGDMTQWLVPTFRHDIECEADLIEEVGRMYGYDNIPDAVSAPVVLTRIPQIVEENVSTIKNALAFAGFREIITNSMVSVSECTLFTPSATPVMIKNPLIPDMACMRTTLVGSLLKTVAFNHNYKNFSNRFFELGKTYVIKDPTAQLPVERDVLGVLIEGTQHGPSWNSEGVATDFYFLKGILEQFFVNAGAPIAQWLPVTGQEMHPWFSHEQAAITGGIGSGVIGRISAEICKKYDIPEGIYYAEVDCTDFLSSSTLLAKYTTLPKFPAIERDFCFVMPETIHTENIALAMKSVSPLIEKVKPFDLYRGEKLGAGLKSIAFSVWMRTADRTLVEADADAVSKSIIDIVKQQFGATLRT